MSTSNIKDVAERAGVSISTVSKVLNNYREIPEATRNRVFRAVKGLGYVPNKSARELSSGSRQYVGLIVSSLNSWSARDEHTLRILSGVHEKCSEEGYDLVLYTTEQIKSRNMSFVDFCRYNSLCGTIVHGLDAGDSRLGELLESPIPCVLIDTECDGANTAFVTTDNFRAASAVADLFARNGGGKICHVTGSPAAGITARRRAGFLSGAKNGGIPEEDIIETPGLFNMDVAYWNIRETIARNGDLTAVFASSDLMALGVFRALKELGLAVGKNFSLVGFDGLTALEYTDPPIASVIQDFYGMGRLAVETLLKISCGEPFEQKNFVDFKLEERKSIAGRGETGTVQLS
ncbi:MAG: LacI family transcriptional regulator [Treponema sp.]|nr:LacI family transcriptional regulator [Treponema sp.]